MRADTAESDKDLVHQVRAGSLASFDSLVTRHQTRIFNYLARKTGNRHEAEDLLQDTFVRAYRNLDKFDDTCRFDAWLYTIASRLAINRRRGADREAIAMEPGKLDERAGSPAPANDREDSDLWEKARQSLNRRQFTAIWLRYIEDMSISEIADAMRISGMNVRITLFRAHRRLQAVVDRSTHSGGERPPSPTKTLRG